MAGMFFDHFQCDDISKNTCWHYGQRWGNISLRNGSSIMHSTSIDDLQESKRRYHLFSSNFVTPMTPPCFAWTWANLRFCLINHPSTSLRGGVGPPDFLLGSGLFFSQSIRNSQHRVASRFEFLRKYQL